MAFYLDGDNERKNIKSNSVAEANDIKNNFDIQGKTYEPNIGSKDYLGRKDHILVNFDTTLLPQLIYDLPKVKNFYCLKSNAQEAWIPERAFVYLRYK